MSHPLNHGLRRTAAALAGAALVLGLAAACGDDDPATDDVSSDSTDSAEEPTDAAPPTPSEPAGTPTDIEVSVVPVYYVGDTPQGDALFREFSQASGIDPLVASAAAVTAGDPVDPDYRTPWPRGRFVSVVETSDAIVVEVPEASWLEADDLDAELAELAVQQLVYSLQGTIGKRLPLRVEYDGQPAPTLLGVDASAGLTAKPELDVLALVNVTEPAEGTTVGGTFTANGRASSFEATVPWRIEDSTGEVVLTGFSTADGWLEKLYPWETEVDVSSLAPGSYTFIAATDDPSAGEGGGPTEDSKRITVE
ncbi:Gmad2 immunoglobulin-like domain-containing protein [Nocardioides caeni]|uniref:Bacterial spore germination immunoglobulin-like domain-containing protein n=1 Tax=Nocardioides caeni TaxID=574700 RepID=A0A4S8NM01_9ACTN|nr:Gmad2 immunoglobulin-like domain-containing protein [Nocardioides caeni]THV17635.1 hypothetical protein E9934_03895 [Nocardioides caeni]